MDAYHYTLSQVGFYGPTNFSSFLNKAIEEARTGVTQESQSYHILLVITVRAPATVVHYAATSVVFIVCLFSCIGRHYIRHEPNH